MKNYTQVYVKNSFEAAETYCKAFGAEITREFKNEDNTAYEHCELSVDGEGFLALAEAKNPCDIDIIHKYKWETMTFNVFEMGTEEAVYNAFQVLSDGGVIIEPIGELPWSICCATIIDKYGESCIRQLKPYNGLGTFLKGFLLAEWQLRLNPQVGRSIREYV